MVILLIADLGITGFNTWVAARKQDWLWFGFSLLSIGLLFIAGIVYVEGVI